MANASIVSATPSSRSGSSSESSRSSTSPRSPWISRWIDARGGYEPIYVGSLGLAVAMMLIIQATGVGGLSAILALAGVFSGTLFLASMYGVGQASAEGQRGSGYALWNLAFSLGYLVGPTVGGHLSSQFDLPTAFPVFAGVLPAGTVGNYLATRGTVAS